MQRYDWEATAYSDDLEQRIWLQYSFTADEAGEKGTLALAYKQAEQRALEEGCDPSTIEDLVLTLTDCDHANFEENPMDGSAYCLDCGKYFKGFCD